MDKINDSDVALESEELGLDAKLGFDAHLLVLFFVFPLVSLCCRAVAIFCFHVSVGCFHLSFAVAEIIEDTKRVVMISARWNLAVGPMLMMGGAFVTVVSLTLLGERNAPKPQDEVSLPSQQRKL